MGKQKRNKNQLSKSSPRTESNDAIKFSKITMKDLEEISSDEDDGEMPPEELWGDDAKALKRAIEGGAFDKLLTNTQDDNDEEFEDIEMDDEDETKDEVSNIDSDDSEGVEQKEIRDEVQINSERAIDSKLVDQDQQINTENRMEDEKEDDAGDNDENQSLTTDNQQNCLTENDSGSKNALSQENSNVSTKAMRFVTDSLQAEKRGWPWAETFDIIVPTPLPFGDDELADNQISVHDDLKREVAFYDIALTAVLDAKKKCLEAGIPFTRPDDFFAEMVKSDEHMARVKDRLIFETKKMDAVAQRKASKEQKLRAKEAQSNKIAEKAKRKKEHFKQLDDWAKSAAANRGRGGLPDNDEMFPSSRNSGGSTALQKGKKRELADKKYGFGGKRGRFKQNDPKELNDFKSFNPRGNFPGIGTKGSKIKKKGGAGASRQGKRARDAKRSR